jgi:chemotaxis signal transduction protein
MTDKTPEIQGAPFNVIVAEEYIVFSLGEQAYGISKRHIEDMFIGPNLAPQPLRNAPPSIAGWLWWETSKNQHTARPIPILNLERGFGLPASPWIPARAAIVLEHNGCKMCLLVTEISGTIILPADEPWTTPDNEAEVLPRFVLQVIPYGGNMLILLNVDEILSQATEDLSLANISN